MESRVNSNNKGMQLIRGGQIFLYNMRMMVQVTKQIGKWAIFTYLIIVLVLISPQFFEHWRILLMQWYCELLNWIGLHNLTVWSGLHHQSFTVKAWLTNSLIQQQAEKVIGQFVNDLVIALIVGLIIYLAFMYFWTKKFIEKGKAYTGEQFISGTKLSDIKDMTNYIKKTELGLGDFKIANQLFIPTGSETQGNLIHGSTGTGKTQLMMDNLDQIREKGEPAIIYDKECVIKPYYFDPSIDKELNPISELCENWDLWLECSNPLEMGNNARFLMPKSIQGSDPFWVDSARSIFTTTAWKLNKWENRDPITLLKVLLTTSLDEMRTILRGTESENLVNKEIEKTAISIKSVLATYTKSLRFLAGLSKSNKPKFSIKEWVQDAVKQDGKRKGWLFITSRSQYHREIKPLLTLWLGLAFQNIQSLPANTKTRIHIKLDEIASLQRMEELSEMLADIRKFGGCADIGMQSYSQLEFLYGRSEAAVIVDLLNNRQFFRSPTLNPTAKWVAGELGDQKVEVIRESQSYGPNSIRDGNTISRQEEKRLTVEPTDITSLQDLHCYVRLKGCPLVTKLKVNYKERRKLIEPLTCREIDFDALEKINTEIKSVENNPAVENGVKILRELNELNDSVGQDANNLENIQDKVNSIKNKYSIAEKIEKNESTLIIDRDI